MNEEREYIVQLHGQNGIHEIRLQTTPTQFAGLAAEYQSLTGYPLVEVPNSQLSGQDSHSDPHQ